MVNRKTNTDLFVKKLLSQFSNNPLALRGAILVGGLQTNSLDISKQYYNNTNFDLIAAQCWELLTSKITKLKPDDPKIAILNQCIDSVDKAISWLKENMNNPEQVVSNAVTCGNKIIFLTDSPKCYYFGEGRLSEDHQLVKLGRGGEIYDVGLYEGEFLDGKWHGNGVYINVNAGSYTGKFIAGKFEDECGEMKFSNGDFYKGCFVAGNPNGKGEGRKTFGNGNVYEGEITNNQFTGYGVGTYKDDKKIYKGNWLNGERHGKGRMIYANGDVCEGEFRNNELCGKVVYTHSDSHLYEGDWLKGKRHGKGTLHSPNGDMYEGDFFAGNYHGHGTLTFKSGNLYEGDWLNGKRHGHGKFKFFDGGSYEGDFVNNNFEGQGVYKFKNNDVYDGKFLAGQCNGYGKFISANNFIYEGNFVKIPLHKIVESVQLALLYTDTAIPVNTLNPNPYSEKTTATPLEGNNAKKARPNTT